MPYNQFKIEDLETKLNLQIIKKSWLNKIPVNFTPDSVLDLLLNEAEEMFLDTEKARSKLLIMPVLQTLRRKNKKHLSILSDYEFLIDKKLGLNGSCDFILSSSENSITLQAPIFCIVEAKKLEPKLRDFAQKIIYGCVTSGFVWAFLKLENNLLTIDPNYVNLSFHNPYMVLNALQYLLDLSLNLEFMSNQE